MDDIENKQLREYRSVFQESIPFSSLDKTLKVLNGMKEKEIIYDYVIGGAVAVIYYVEPIQTSDLDIFMSLSVSGEPIVDLSPIYHYLKKKGYKEKNEHIEVEGIPVQFLPANNIGKDALTFSNKIKIKGVKTKIMKPEYLLAMALDTNRAKDRIKVSMLIEQADLDENLLEKILKKFNLQKKYEKFLKVYYEE